MILAAVLIFGGAYSKALEKVAVPFLAAVWVMG